MIKHKKRTLSGIKPTGSPHLGNYLGMIKPALAMQESHETFYFIADYHALTSVQDPDELKKNTYDLVAIFSALGMDFDNHTFFRQSDVPEVTELTWLLSCVTPLGLLERAHAYKDARQKNEEVNHGLFAYPVLMAADIIIYDSDEVPVGKDQKQHLEMTRDIAQRFNRIYGETFIVPEARIAEEVATIPGIDGRKMSKSYHNQIPLFSSEKELRKRIMKIVTDSKGVEEPKDPESCNVFQMFSHFAHKEEQESWAKRYREGGLGYGEIKQATFEAINSEIEEYRKHYFSVRDDIDRLQGILRQGGEKAREVAAGVLQRARKKMGLS